MGSSKFAAPTSMMYSIGPDEEGNTSSKVPTSTGFIKEGLGSLNRWSQSTTSSKSPPNNHLGHHRGISSLSGYGDYVDLNPPNGLVNSGNNNLPRQLGQTVDTYSADSQSRSPHRSVGGERAELRTLALESPPSPGSPVKETSRIPSQTSLMIATSSSNLPPDRSRAHETKTGQHDAVNDSPNEQNQTSNEIDSMLSEDALPFLDENSRGRRHRGHSQKAMLSKALQKANTAVLLDNAANFEGAMDAYNEACQLLQLVMFRSSSGSGEKLKLQEIVCFFRARLNNLPRN